MYRVISNRSQILNSGTIYGPYQARRDSRPPLANARSQCTQNVYPETEQSAGIGIDRKLSELVRNCVIRKLLLTGKYCRNFPIDDMERCLGCCANRASASFS